MAVKKPFIESNLNEKDIENLISKGASVKEDNKPNVSNSHTFVNLRIPRWMLDKITLDLKNRVGIKRAGWIMEAIHEKLKKIERENNHNQS